MRAPSPTTRHFARALLDHKNPYTGLRWADDPALAWLSLVNEGNPGNFLPLLKGRLLEDWTRAWNQWLVARYPDRETRRQALGGPEPPGPMSLPLRDDGGPK